jgi:hypothetical protein
MTKTIFLTTIAAALCGCSSTQNTAQTAPASTSASTSPEVKSASLSPQEELKKFCRVCVQDKGEKIEEFLPTRLDTPHAGQTYKFCSDDCKKSFNAAPQKYALKSMT